MSGAFFVCSAFVFLAFSGTQIRAQKTHLIPYSWLTVLMQRHASVVNILGYRKQKSSMC